MSTPISLPSDRALRIMTYCRTGSSETPSSRALERFGRCLRARPGNEFGRQQFVRRFCEVLQDACHDERIKPEDLDREELARVIQAVVNASTITGQRDQVLRLRTQLIQDLEEQLLTRS